MRKLACILAGAFLSVAAFATGTASAAQVYPANVYFHFTDGHGADFRVPQAVPGLKSCDQAKLAVIAKAVQKSVPLYASWTYVRAECKGPRR